MLKRLLVALTFVFVACFALYFQSIQPVTHQSAKTVSFEVKPGWGIDRISEELSQKQLIRSRLAFKITVIRLGISNRIQAGLFDISPNMTASEIAQKLTKAHAFEIRVTIPEGLRRQEIALLISQAFKGLEGAVFSSDEFIELTKNQEGKIFPDTYDFDPKVNAQEVVNRLTNQYDKVVSELKIPTAKLSEVTILASLLEREAANANEMPEVAGVIQNRLNSDWPLQIDATVQYFLGTSRCRKLDCEWWPKNLTRNDLAIDSPYNTYINQGLPPTPISNPGRSALNAAASPLKTENWFYLHDPAGKIHFAKTIEEHNQNVCQYLKKDCN